MKDPIAAAKGKREPTSIPGSLGRIDRDASAPQCKEDRPAPGSSGDVPVNSWLRGGGEDATRMPHFDHSGPSGNRSSSKRK